MIVELKAVAVTFCNNFFLVSIARNGTLLQVAWVKPKPHCAAHVLDILLVGHQIYHRVFGGSVKFSGVDQVSAKHRPRKFHDHQLHTQAQSKVGDFLGACHGSSLHFSFDDPSSKAARNNNTIHAFQGFPAFAFFQISRMDPSQFKLYACANGGMLERFPDG